MRVKIVILFLLLNPWYSKCQLIEYEKVSKFFKSNKKNTNDSNKLKIFYAKWERLKLPKDSLFGLVNYALGKSLYLEGSHLDALKYLQQALKIFESQDTKISSVPRVYSLLGQNFSYLKKYEEAKNYLIESIKLANSKYDQIAISQAYLHLSSIFYEEGDFQLAFQNLEMGKKFAYLSKNSMMISNIENQEAIINNSMGEFDLALKAEKLAINAAIESKDKELIARQYQMMGRIYANKKEINRAIESYQNAIKILGNLNPVVSTSLQINIGYLYLTKIKDYDKSLIYFQEALKIVTDPYQELRIYDNIGYVYSQKKDFQNAFLNYQKGFKAISEGFDINNFKNIPNSELIKRAANKEYLLTLTEDKAATWLEYYQVTKDKKNLIEAKRTFFIIDKMIDFMRWEHKGDDSKINWRKRTRSIYQSAIETCFLLKDYEKAFYFFEKSRAVLLNDKLNELGAKQNLSEQDKKQEAELQSKIDDLRKKLSEEKKNKESLEKELLTAETEQEKFIKSLETKNPAYYQLKYDTTTVSLKQFQKYLSSFGGLGIEYFIGDNATYAIVVSPKSVELKKLNFDAKLSQQYLDLAAKNLSTKTELNEFLSVGHQIYQSLIAPLNLPKGRIIISQDGAILPFEALSKTVSKTDYLLNDYAISYTYSAQFLFKNQEKFGFLPNKTFLGVAPVNFQQKLNSLEGSIESLEKIKKNYLLGKQLTHQAASLQNFLSQAGQYKIVQIYTHAFADSNESEPRIHLADSALRISDLNLSNQFKTKLLVLAACKTGIGKVAKGEGVLSLARGFSMAGIPSTITSLWSVEDQATYQLTEFFYEFLNEGLPKDEALKKAKLKFIENNPDTNPSSWAGIILVGDASEMENGKLIWWILGSILLISAVLFYWKKTHKPIR